MQHLAVGQIVVNLSDGSRVRATDIIAADATGLRVAAVADRIRIERTLAWGQVLTAEVGGTAYNTAELRLALTGTHAAAVPVAASCGRTFAAAPISVAPTYAIPLAVVSACGPPLGFALPRSRVIGVRQDPVAAYADLLPEAYPAGVPISEVPFAMSVLRERRRAQTVAPFLGPAVTVPSADGFGLPLPPAGPFPPGTPLPLAAPVPGFGDRTPPPAAGTEPLARVAATVETLATGGTADLDTLAIDVIGLTADGQALPVEGTAQLSLIAARQKPVLVADDIYAARPEAITTLANWTRAITPGQRLLLPLPNPLPDQSATLSAVGALRVRLAIPGRGVFETFIDPVALRSASPFRDALAVQTGSRFLPGERISGRRLTNWPHPQDLSDGPGRN